MKRLILALCGALALAGCAGLNAQDIAGAGATVADAVGAPAPGTFAGKVVLDEKAAIGLETAYTAASKGAAVAIRAGFVTDKATIKRIGELDNKAFLALAGLRAAYAAGNADSYRQAFAEADAAIKAITTLF